MRLPIIIFFLMLVSTSFSVAEDLSEEALFYRCYAHITRGRPNLTLPQLIDVKNNIKTAVQACAEILAKANFTASGQTQIANTSDVISKSVLKTFHNLHSNWFTQKNLSITADPCLDGAANDLYDATTPALYVTRSMFRPGLNFKSIVSGTAGVQPIRTNMTPSTGPYTGKNWPLTYYDTGGVQRVLASYAPKGELLGVKVSVATPAPPLLTYNYLNAGLQENVNVDIYGSHGGGLIGHQSYLIGTIAEQPDFRRPELFSSDGAESLPRRWSKAVFKDLLCRDLPVIRISDAKPYVRPNSSVSFRKSNSCTHCHASMDRMAYTIRGMRYAGTGLFTGGSFKGCQFFGGTGEGGSFLMYRKPASLPPASEAWPSEPDVDFHKRPDDGVLYYRSYSGKLVHKSYQGLDQLGDALSQEDDLYVCAAKRYFKYFTGIDVNLADIGDPINKIELSTGEESVRNTVISLGKNLKNHQSLQQLVQEIISLPLYKKEDYGIGESNE